MNYIQWKYQWMISESETNTLWHAQTCPKMPEQYWIMHAYREEREEEKCAYHPMCTSKKLLEVIKSYMAERVNITT